MTLTVEIPDKVVKHAQQVGRPVEDLVTQAIDQIAETSPTEDRRGPPPEGFMWLGRAIRTREEAAASIRDIASRSTLGGLKVRDLIEEERRY